MPENIETPTTRLREIREQLTEESWPWGREHVQFLSDLISTQEGKIEAARAALEAAPHGRRCIAWDCEGPDGAGHVCPCNCWKVKALAALGGTEK